MKDKQALLARVRSIAQDAHAGQTRWGGEDYFEHHVEPVAQDALRRFGTDAAIVGYLHDVLEDTDYPEDRLKALLRDSGRLNPDELFEAVKALTKGGNDDESYLTYLPRLLKSKIAIQVKISDICNNISTPEVREAKSGKNRQRREKYEAILVLLRLALSNFHQIQER